MANDTSTVRDDSAIPDGSPIADGSALPDGSPERDHIQAEPAAVGSPVIRGTSRSAAGAAAVRSGGDAIDILMNDHRVVKGLFADLLDAPRRDDRLAILDELKAVLTVHNATEENLVYPAVRLKAGRHADADTLYHQQDEAKVAIFEIDDMLKNLMDSATLDARISALESAVLAHVKKEEETEFPLLREALGADGMADLTDAVLEFREEFGFDEAA